MGAGRGMMIWNSSKININIIIICKSCQSIITINDIIIGIKYI